MMSFHLYVFQGYSIAEGKEGNPLGDDNNIKKIVAFSTHEKVGGIILMKISTM